MYSLSAERLRGVDMELVCRGNVLRLPGEELQVESCAQLYEKLLAESRRFAKTVWVGRYTVVELTDGVILEFESSPLLDLYVVRVGNVRNRRRAAERLAVILRNTIEGDVSVGAATRKWADVDSMKEYVDNAMRSVSAVKIVVCSGSDERVDVVVTRGRLDLYLYLPAGDRGRIANSIDAVFAKSRRSILKSLVASRHRLYFTVIPILLIVCYGLSLFLEPTVPAMLLLVSLLAVTIHLLRRVREVNKLIKSIEELDDNSVKEVLGPIEALLKGLVRTVLSMRRSGRVMIDRLGVFDVELRSAGGREMCTVYRLRKL